MSSKSTVAQIRTRLEGLAEKHNRQRIDSPITLDAQILLVQSNLAIAEALQEYNEIERLKLDEDDGSPSIYGALRKIDTTLTGIKSAIEAVARGVKG